MSFPITEDENCLESRLLRAQESAKGVAKDGTNEFAKFGYTSVEEVVKTCRALLHGQGLVFYPGHQILDSSTNVVFLSQTYILASPLTDETREITRTMVIPENGKMSPCQAQGSAESYMLKNTLRELLLLPRFDKSEDLDSHDNTKEQPPLRKYSRQ